MILPEMSKQERGMELTKDEMTNGKLTAYSEKLMSYNLIKRQLSL